MRSLRTGIARPALLLALLLIGCAGPAEPALPTVQIVTVVVSATAGATQTPWVIEKIRVVTATPAARAAAEPSATRGMGSSATATTAGARTATATTAPVRASPTATRTATALPTRAATATVPAAGAAGYPAVTLLEPGDGTGFGADRPRLRWSAVPLASDEYYEVTIERLWQGQLYYAGSEWVQEPFYVVPEFVVESADAGAFTWWVTIKRLTGTGEGGGKVGLPLSPPSERRTFNWLR